MSNNIVGSRNLSPLFLLLPALVLAGCDSDSGTDPGPTLESVELEAAAEAIDVGDTTRVTATVRDEEGNIVPDADVTFSSASEIIATVDSEGLVTGMSPGAVTITGSIGVDSDAVVIEVWSPCDFADLVEIPGTVNGTLESGDCDEILEDGSLTDPYYFELSDPATVTVTMSSEDLDAYLFVLDEAFEVLDQNDDGAGGTDAMLEMELPAGLYYLLANTFPGETGDYTLTLAAEDGGSVAMRVMDGADRTRPFTAPRRIERQ